MTTLGFTRMLGLLLAAGALTGCGDCSDEIKAANDFLVDPANLQCASDADCVAVSVGCADTVRNHCGQVGLNSEAAASKEWQAISAALSDCEEGSCEQCLASLVPTCSLGQCSR